MRLIRGEKSLKKKLHALNTLCAMMRVVKVDCPLSLAAENLWGDWKRLGIEGIFLKNFPVPVLAEAAPQSVADPRKRGDTRQGGEAREGTNTNLKRTARKWHADFRGGET